MEVPEETKEPNPAFPESSAPASATPAPAGEPESVSTKPSADSAAAPITQPVTPATKAESATKASDPVKTAVPETAPKPADPTKPVTAVAATGDKPAAPATAAKPAAPAAAPAAAKPAAPAAKPAPKPEGPKPEPWDSDLVRSLKSQYGSGIREASTYVGQKYLVVDSSIIYEILLRMRNDELFDYCVDITAVHYPKREGQFDIVYILYSFKHNERVRIKTQIKDGETLRSVVGIWETANWLEREVFDMFGISFDGHPDLKRILLPEDWKGYPLRKDYPILQQDQEWVKINLGIESGQ
ncbi:MAG: NADH-quinone oxidoreductase subunit C [Candidatus Korobacteraceae bacterium]|jgi:NADH-quinone oxidoreductase subunit C